ncbi:MAG: methionine sulfoxide reductase heme-binding subunit [Rugosibacter sp.]|nr:methionine sulfoxide reductase heme-binding subunit [Rugosibacter sp.]
MRPQLQTPAQWRLKPLWLKALVFISSAMPLGWYAFGIQADSLGANPIEAIARGLGTWALNFLLMTLAATPLKHFAHWTWPLLIRRMLGLFAFFYASLHLLSYLWFDQFFDWPSIIKDIFKRPFITVGMATFLLLCPLAMTSTDGAIRRLGLPRWKKLHRLVYLAGILAVLHYFWMVKADMRTPLMYAVGLTLLLGLRAAWLLHKHRRPNRQ